MLLIKTGKKGKRKTNSSLVVLIVILVYKCVSVIRALLSVIFVFNQLQIKTFSITVYAMLFHFLFVLSIINPDYTQGEIRSHSDVHITHGAIQSHMGHVKFVEGLLIVELDLRLPHHTNKELYLLSNHLTTLIDWLETPHSLGDINVFICN